MKDLAGHRQVSTTNIYSKGGEVGRIKVLKDLLRVPNLVIESSSREQLQETVMEYPPYLKYLKIDPRWMKNLTTRFPDEDHSLIDFCIPNSNSLDPQGDNSDMDADDKKNKDQSVPIHPTLPTQYEEVEI